MADITGGNKSKQCPLTVESPLVVKTLPGPELHDAAKSLSIVGSSDDEQEEERPVCEGSVTDTHQDDALLNLCTYSEVSVAMLCRTYNDNLRDNTFTLRDAAADEWAAVSGYNGDTAKGVNKTEIAAFYNSLSRPELRLQRDIEVRRWRRHGTDPYGSPPIVPMWSAPCVEPWIKTFLKEHSIVNSAFFRPPKAHYDETLADLIYLSLPNCNLDVPARWLPFPRSRGVVIFAHGNACDIGQNPVVQSYRSTFEMSVLGLEWPGYGLAEGKPTECNLSEVLLDTILYIHSELDVPLDRIILYGRSLATGPCVQAAAMLERQGLFVGAMILKSPYLSWCHIVKHLGKNAAGCLTSAAARLVFNRFESYKSIAHVTCPLMIIHGMLDPVIPYDHSSRLYGLAGTPVGKKELHLVETGDHDMGIELWSEMKKFTQKLNWEKCPFVTTFPDVCYNVKDFAKKARQSTRRRVLWRRAKLSCVGITGLICVGWGAYAVSVCSGLLAAWCIFHGTVTLAASLVYLVADWVQEDLNRAQDRFTQITGGVSLLLLFISWLANIIWGHVALFTRDCDTDPQWYGCFACMAAVNYVFILQALITNK